MDSSCQNKVKEITFGFPVAEHLYTLIFQANKWGICGYTMGKWLSAIMRLFPILLSEQFSEQFVWTSYKPRGLIKIRNPQ